MADFLVALADFYPSSVPRTTWAQLYAEQHEASHRDPADVSSQALDRRRDVLADVHVHGAGAPYSPLTNSHFPSIFFSARRWTSASWRGTTEPLGVFTR